MRSKMICGLAAGVLAANLFGSISAGAAQNAENNSIVALVGTQETVASGKQVMPRGGIAAYFSAFGKTTEGNNADGIQSYSLDPEEPGQVQDSEEENEYADLAIANVRNYVNVRSEASINGKIVGKIYNGAVAHVLEITDGEDGDWFRMVSGNVEGYIKAEYFIYGDDAAQVIDEYVTRYAVVNVTRLNVRKEPGIEAKRIGYIDSGERVKLLEDLGEWLKVQYTSDKTGYVSAQYVNVVEEFIYAKTLEEEAAERAAQRALEERQKASEEKAAENTVITVTPPAGDYATTSELRSAIVDYSMQFLGNKYVNGGKSLTTGTDCSGFTSMIYAEFGYSLSRTPSGQLSGAGRAVSYSEIQPGDIICYGSKQCTHVALYIGDGQIIHSANSRRGVVIDKADIMNILGVRNIVD